MNAVVGLCHFCEMHGPSVLLCTQAFHDPEDPQRVLNGKPNTKQEEKRYYGRPDVFVRSNSTSSEPSQDSSNKTSGTEPCVACRPLSSGQAEYICNDHEAKVSYISSQYPYHPEVFSIVRQACVRSLSCEVCPGREGPIFFGDDHRGHVFSHTFFLKDSHARGFQRWYSIIVVMMDKIFLLNSWPFLVKHIRSMIIELQEKAKKVYDSEQSECPQRAMRLNSMIFTTPGDFRRQRGVNKPLRSLYELTNDKDVFANLHLWFTWILKAGGNRLTEKLLEGPPTEDTVIDLEKQEETEEGFMLIATKKIPKEYSRQLESSGEESDNGILSDSDLKIENIRHLVKVLGKETFHILAYHVVIGNQTIIRSSKPGLVTSIIQTLKLLLPKGCFRPIFFSQEYQDSWKCNFLGLPLSVDPPPHVKTSQLHILMDVTSSVENSHNLADYSCQLESAAELPEKLPVILTKMENAIQDSNLSDGVLDCFFTSLKEEWMNRVKVLFKFSRAASRSTEDTQKLLHVLGAQEHDKQAMKFWMTGLSAQFKTHVLSATMSQCHGNEGAS